jgi:hypothetical protein
MTDSPAPQRISLTSQVAAPRSAVFALVSDPAGQVTIDGSGMLLGAPDPRPLTAVGQTFLVDMDREPLGDFPQMGRYQVINTVTAFEPDVEIAWNVHRGTNIPMGHVYGYHLEDAAGGGTTVTSYYDWSAVSEEMLARLPWPVVPESMLGATLENLKRVAESGTPGV